ncbi:hypothetical protein HPP92_006124 [Vanilla planifolia]|uniref:SOUL heme-binding protein n=1 Tax=Vanilla planifolia TaxID=51239 RepID=A0A835VFI6_VANPL|nr:hypothetical protein HPP92_006124 [Vanilla planifolia]
MLHLWKPSVLIRPPHRTLGSQRGSPVIMVEAAQRHDAASRSRSGLEARVSLVQALSFQAISQSQRVLAGLLSETAKYAFPRRFEARNLEEALMAVPDLETIRFRVIKRTDRYEIREVEPYYVAETTMPGKNGFDFNGASQSFNVLAAYLFGKNTANEQMEMTTPVYTRKVRSDGERMDMTMPVISKRASDKWNMSFVMPSKYGDRLPIPKDPSVRIKEISRRTVAVSAFSGFVADEDVKKREFQLRDALKSDAEFQAKEDAMVEVAQFNPPFTLPFMRRNEIMLEVERKAG